MMQTPNRVFEVLVRTLRGKRPELLRTQFTVAELYQQILPFRHYRRELELETVAEYEMALMQLLSGAGGLLDVDEKLRDQLGRELSLPNADPSRVRDFADATVSVNKQAEARVANVTRPEQPRVSGVLRAPAMPDEPRCRYCSGSLPEGRELHFCPHCGQNLQVLNCPGCGADIEADWKFCVSCGKAVPESLREDS
jgi:hypothetical protein